MSGHLCLKWNNHSTAFLSSISRIQIKERYCDATIVCQGKYFPVHRVILSTCSDYFEEMFERISCTHPYIVFKDIEPEEMQLLLNYMYQGEVNVTQEKLPTLIKAAEALKIKGLAVPDDLPANKESSGKKRSHQSDENSQSKRRHEEKRKRTSLDINPENNKDGIPGEHIVRSNERADEDEPKIIKQEPLDSYEYVEATPLTTQFSNTEEMTNDNSIPSVSNENQVVNKEDTEYPVSGESFIKSEENEPPEESYDDQSSWTDYGDSDLQNLNMPQTSQQDDVSELFVGSSECDYNNDGSSTHQEGSNYQCLLCDYSCKKSSALKSHVMFKHTGERPFACSICPRRFTMKNDLKIHTRIHSGEKPYQCPKCFRRFTTKSNQKSHLMNKTSCI